MNRNIAITALTLVLTSFATAAHHEKHGPAHSEVGTQTKASQADLSPAAALQILKDGNARYVAGLRTNRDYLAQAAETASGQYPFAIVLSCVDSRVPAEIVFDQGIGDIFSARVAGNIATAEMLGSMEFATAAAGSKVVLVLGHSACGAVKGAIDEVKLGNLTTLLDGIEPAVKATKLMKDEKRSSKHGEYVDRVAMTNVKATMDNILEESPVIADMVKSGKIVLAGGMYDLHSGQVTFID